MGKKIGFIGVGHMGMPMATNLLAKGYKVAVYDLNNEAITTLVAAGALGCDSALQAAQDQDAVITMLPGGAQVAALYLGEQGLLKTIRKSTLFLECSTIDIETSTQVHDLAKQRQHLLLDAPVSGGVAGATAGTLTFMVGGESDAFARAQPILQAMGKNIFHAGAATHGQVAKICNNLMLGIQMIGTSEAFNLAEQLGLAKEKLFAIASVSSGQSWTLNNYCPAPGLVPDAPANRDYQPGFAALMMLKDLRLALAAGNSSQVKLPLTEMAENIFSQMCQKQGDLDFSAVIKFLKNHENV